MALKRTWTCSVPDCDGEHEALGLCKVHYQRMWAKGTTDAPIKRSCSVAGCEEAHKARDLCSTHLQRLHRYGTTALPEPPQPMPPCSHEGCIKSSRYRINGGLCAAHYHQVWRSKHKYKKCKIPNCEHDAIYTGVGLCSTHYKTRNKHAHTL